MPGRLGLDYFMEIAMVVARRSTCLHRQVVADNVWSAQVREVQRL
jgi:deoxycytidylate deaminase